LKERGKIRKSALEEKLSIVLFPDPMAKRGERNLSHSRGMGVPGNFWSGPRINDPLGRGESRIFKETKGVGGRERRYFRSKVRKTFPLDEGEG